MEIVSQARLLLREDLALLGIRWDPATLPPEVLDNPDRHRNNANASSAGKVEHEQNRVKNGECNGTDDHEEEKEAGNKPRNNTAADESKREEGNLEPGGNLANAHLDGPRINDGTEPVSRQSAAGQSCKETKKPGTSEGGSDMQTERRNQEMGKSKVVLPSRSESEPANRPLEQRSLTQELAEIISSPLPELTPRPQLSLSPVTPPRFRAPVSRAEAQETFPSNASGRRGTAGLVVSPVRPGRPAHARVLNKVLLSIQADKSPQGDVQVASLAQGPAPGGRAPKQAQAASQEAPVGAPINANVGVSPPPLSPASTPFPPEAKRRRTDGEEADTFSSPELYACPNRDEEPAEAAERSAGASFGDSFELDTQTEQMMVQLGSPHRDGGEFGVNRSTETETTRTTKTAVVVEGRGTVTPGGETEVRCPGLGISITESQMEFILNSSQEASDQTNHSIRVHIHMFVIGATRWCGG